MRASLCRLADRLLPAPLAVAELGHQFARAHVLAALAELGVADVISSEPKTSAELSAKRGCDPDALHGLLRAWRSCPPSAVAILTRCTACSARLPPSAPSVWARTAG